MLHNVRCSGFSQVIPSGEWTARAVWWSFWSDDSYTMWHSLLHFFRIQVVVEKTRREGWDSDLWLCIKCLLVERPISLIAWWTTEFRTTVVGVDLPGPHWQVLDWIIQPAGNTWNQFRSPILASLWLNKSEYCFCLIVSPMSVSVLTPLHGRKLQLFLVIFCARFAPRLT